MKISRGRFRQSKMIITFSRRIFLLRIRKTFILYKISLVLHNKFKTQFYFSSFFNNNNNNNNKNNNNSIEHKGRRNTKSYRRPTTRQQCIFTLSNVGRTSFPCYGTTCPRYSWGTDFRFMYLYYVVILMHTGFVVSLFLWNWPFFLQLGKGVWYYLIKQKKRLKWRNNFEGDEQVLMLQ